jgi:hypothetical protein
VIQLPAPVRVQLPRLPLLPGGHNALETAAMCSMVPPTASGGRGCHTYPSEGYDEEKRVTPKGRLGMRCCRTSGMLPAELSSSAPARIAAM